MITRNLLGVWHFLPQIYDKKEKENLYAAKYRLTVAKAELSLQASEIEWSSINTRFIHLKRLYLP